MTGIRDKLKELKKGLAIDKYELDEELIRQPSKFNEASELAVAASARRDFLKEECSRIDAELYAEHRRRLEKLHGKATEKQLEHAVILDKKHKAASEAFIKAKELADLAQSLKDTFHQRRYMLQELSGLFVANYFESSSANSANMREYKANKARDGMAEARKRKKRE